MRLRTAMLGIVMGALLVFLLAEAPLGQPKRKKAVRKPHPTRVVKKRHVVHRKAVSKLPARHVKVVVGPRSYWYSHGVFYRHGPSGYVVRAAPVGARVKVLPVGFRTITVTGRPYHHYYGTYYVHDSKKDDYVVVEPPVEEVYADVVYLVDGETLEGTFMGGSEESIEFEAEGEVLEIPLVDIVSITFEPPPPDEEE